MDTVIRWISFSWGENTITAPTAGGDIPEYGIFLTEESGFFDDGIAVGEAIERWGANGSILPTEVYRSGKVMDFTLTARASSVEQTRAFYNEIKSMVRHHTIRVDSNWMGPYTCRMVEDTTTTEWLGEHTFSISFILKAREGL